MDDNDEGLEALLKSMGEGIVAAQSRAFASFFILEEVVTHLAETSPDGEAVLAKLYDRVTARMDQFLTENPGEVAIQWRRAIDEFFPRVSKRLAAQRDQPGRKPPRA